MPPPIWVQSC